MVVVVGGKCPTPCAKGRGIVRAGNVRGEHDRGNMSRGNVWIPYVTRLRVLDVTHTARCRLGVNILIHSLSSLSKPAIYHSLNSSSEVITATFNSYGNRQISTPPTKSILLNRSTKKSTQLITSARPLHQI